MTTRDADFHMRQAENFIQESAGAASLALGSLQTLRKKLEDRPEVAEMEELRDALDRIHAGDRGAMEDWLKERHGSYGMTTLSDFGIAVRVAAVALGREY